MIQEEACQILGIEIDGNIEAVKDAYRYHCNLLHPDKTTHLSDKFKKKAEADYLNVGKAYNFLIKRFQSTKQDESSADLFNSGSIPLNPLGVSLDIFGCKAGENETVKQLLSSRTFIGIDFGTSTTVASYIKINKDSGALKAEPIGIIQNDELGRTNKHHLVPSCIAYTGKDILVGRGAANLKQEYQLWGNIWFSFKMELGENLGSNKYYNTRLKGHDGGASIKNPIDATSFFFTYLRRQIEDFIAENNLPSSIYYSISVPAAFEANQRQDLCKALKSAGIELPEHGIIDEPNAAFVSYFHKMFTSQGDMVGYLEERKRKILVFDFGAGTCDISILEVGLSNDRFISKNRSISRFHELGGDNIDRRIVRQVLLNQFFDQNNVTEDDFTSREIDQAIIPRLQGTAENLKINCCKYIQNNWDGSYQQPFISSDRQFTGNDLLKIRIGNINRKLLQPTLSIAEFADVMQPFLALPNAGEKMPSQHDDVISIFDPILSAIEKAEIKADELDMILFIGGSAENPFVQSAIKEYFGRFVETSNLRDIRIPVSQGVALNSFMVNGLRCEVVRSITSEPIYILTKDTYLHEIVPAGTEIPSEEFLISDLEIEKDGQQIIQLPVCVTNKNKRLHVIEVTATPTNPFRKGDRILLKCYMDENKILNVSGKIREHAIQSILINPLANKELSEKERKHLIAKRRLNESIVADNGRPSLDVIQKFIDSCSEAELHLEAAEAFRTAERLYPEYNYAQDICYHYDRAGKKQLSSKYGRIAYERQPNAMNAYNLAIGMSQDGNELGFGKYIQIAYEKDKNNPVIIATYGNHLLGEDRTTEGLELLRSAFNIFKSQFDKGELRQSDYSRLEGVANSLGESDVVQKINDSRQIPHQQSQDYDEENLAVSARKNNIRLKG